MIINQLLVILLWRSKNYWKKLNYRYRETQPTNFWRIPLKQIFRGALIKVCAGECEVKEQIMMPFEFIANRSIDLKC